MARLLSPRAAAFGIAAACVLLWCLSPALAAEIRGTVTDDLGKPISGARVSLYGRLTGAGRLGAETDETGKFVVSVRAAGEYRLSASAEGHKSESRDISVEADKPTQVDVRLDRLAWISGRIKLPCGGPLANANVTIRMNRAGLVSGTSVQTSADGAYRASTREPGTYSVEVIAPGYAAVSLPDVQVARGEETTGVDVVLGGPSAGIAGMVYDTDGRTPKPGAYVWAVKVDRDDADPFADYIPQMVEGRPEAMRRFSSPNTTADAEGSFRLTDIAEGTYRVYAQAEGRLLSRAQDAVVVARAQQVTGVRIALQSGASVSGTVYGIDGRPLANARVYGALRSRSSEPGYRSSALYITTDGLGRYSLGPLQAGAYELSLRAEGNARSAHSVTITGADSVTGFDIRFTAGCTLTVLVLAPDGQPAKGAQVTAYRVADGRREYGESGTTDAEGRARLPQLVDGKYEVTVKSDTAMPASRSDIVIAGGTAPEVRIQLREGATLAGLVVDDRGNPVPGARIRAYCRQPDPAAGAPGFSYGSSSLMANDEGRFVMRGLQGGVWSLSAEAKGHIDTRTEAPVGDVGQHEVQIVMPKAWSGRLEGQVLMADGKTPVANVDARLDLLIRRDDQYQPIGVERAHTDAEGRFSVEVEKAIHAVRIGAEDWLPSTVDIEPSDRPTEQVVVQVLQPARLRGRVEAGDAPIPADGLYVLAVPTGQDVDVRDLTELNPERGVAMVTAEKLDWEITGLETGEFDVFTYAPGWPTSVPKRVQLKTGETVEVVVDVPLPGSVAGRVVSANGLPLAGARVYAYTSGGRIRYQFNRANTDGEGRFQLDNLTPGPARLRVLATGYATSPHLEVTVVALDTVHNVEFKMLLGGEVTGTVRRADGQPPKVSYRVRLEAEGDEERYRTAYVSADGTFRIEHVHPGTYRLVLQTRDATNTLAEREGVTVVNEQVTEPIELVIEE